MMKRRWLSLFLLALGLALGSERAFAQATAEPDPFDEMLRKSHHIFQLPSGTDPNDFLLKRLQSKQLAGFLEDYKKGRIDEKKLSEFLHDFKPDAKNDKLPQGLAETLEQLRQPGGLAALSDEKRKNLLDVLRKLHADLLGGLGTSDGGLSPKNDDPVKGGAEAESNRGDGSSGGAGGPASSEPETQGADASSPFTERLISLTEKLAPALRRSPALQKVMRELSRYTGQEDPRWQKMSDSFKGMGEKVGGWSQSLHANGIRLPEGFTWPARLTPGGLSGLRFPSNVSLGGLRAPGAALSAGAPPSSSGQGWEAVLGIAGLLGLAVIIAKVLARAQARQAGGSDEGWQLGPWPVDPAAVATREELIRAFEYLSLRNLGPAARNWNHRAIANRLRDAASSSEPMLLGPDRGAVDELALLYERARYAPPSDPLPDSALVHARRDLCLLAGVSSA
jgi:hypothetical protein